MGEEILRIVSLLYGKLDDSNCEKCTLKRACDMGTKNFDGCSICELLEEAIKINKK